MPDPLVSLQIVHLRGSTQSFTMPFTKGAKLTIIYGENGTGKSTICDAFDLLGNGEVGSLESRKGIGSKESRWASLGKTKGDISIQLKTLGAVITAAVGKNGPTVTPSNHGLAVRVLRRATVQALIEAEPGKRYEAIRHFIDVTGIEQAEENLRSALKNLEDDLARASLEIDTNTEELQRDWTAMGSPGESARAWAAALGNDQEERKQLATARATADQLRQTLTSLGAARAARQTAQDAIAPRETERNQAQAIVEEAKAEIAVAASQVIDILRSAQTYFERQTQFDVCPLCQSAENVAGLAAKTRERIAGFTQLQRYEETRRDLEIKDKAVARAQEIAKEKAEAYELARAAWLKAAQEDQSAFPFGPPDESKFDAWRQATTTQIDQSVATVDEAAGKITLLDRAKASLRNLKANEDRYTKTDAVKPRLSTMLGIVERERKQFTDTILGEIANEVGRLYEAVHPGEGKDKIVLQLDPKRRGSLSITAHFEGLDDTPPQAYFSDSHLDTLGLCIYLSLAERTNPANTIIVMDDVLGSVDEPHVDRLIHMLYAAVQSFRHCVVTTHYRPWKEKYRWGELQTGNCQFIELAKWTLADGIDLTGSVPEVERLRHALTNDPGDHVGICGRAGVVLERLLLFICARYECNLPYLSGRGHTLAQYLDGLGKKLRERLRVDVCMDLQAGVYQTVAIGEIIAEIDKMDQARNVFGCHYNELANHLPQKDAIAFGQKVLAVADALICPECGWPTSNKSGEYWATANHTRRLHPLQKPS